MDILGMVKEGPFVLLVALAIVAAVGLGFPLSLWIGRVWGDYLAGASTERLRGPVPMMGKASTLAMRGQLNEAAALYEQFLLRSPRNAEIYLRLLEIAYGPLQDHQYGDRILHRAKKKLSRADFQTAAELSEAIINKQLFPLKHLGWCEHELEEHPEVEIPESLQGQFAKQAG